MTSSIATSPEVPLSAIEADSWRSRAPPRSTALPDLDTASSTVPPPSLPLLAEVESLHLTGGRDVEVVEFSDMGKFVGVEPSAGPVLPQRLHMRPPRPGAADFFDDRAGPGVPAHTAIGSDSSWRRRLPAPDSQPLSEDLTSPSRTKDKLRVQIIPSNSPSFPSSSPVFHARASPPYHRQHDDRLHLGAVPSHPGHSSQRSPLTPSFREAPISALDDVMSRIKGALDDMHTKEEPHPKAQKWLPPALRLKNNGHDIAQPSETFDVTASEPPRSPKPVWKVFSVKLPKSSSRGLPPIGARQLLEFQRAAIFWSAVYSRVPPISGQPYVDVSAEDHLFGSSSPTPNRVALPPKRLSLTPAILEQAGPIVNLPSRHARVSSVASASREVEIGSWHKSSASEQHGPLGSGIGLNTISRSPPPEVPLGIAASLPKSEPTSPNCSVDIQGKPHPKTNMHVSTTVEIDPVLVLIMIHSRPLSPPSLRVTGQSHMRARPAMATRRMSNLQQEARIPDVKRQASHSQTHRRRHPLSLPNIRCVHVYIHTVRGAHTGLQVDHPGVTSSGAINSSWSKSPRAFTLKDSPSRGVPDPEHLKAVWSQASDKAALPSVNSLEGIADDLTAVPFTIQDVKSEDGGTPPPSGPGLSRISSYDVTRAFQQVPTSSVKSPPRNTILPPPVNSAPNGPVPRPAYSYTSSLRPAYPYPSPVLSHSPSPTVIYPPQMAPSPAPRPMVLNGPPSPYGQPMWMPMGGPQPQNPLMRPMAPPYAPQYVPYPSPGAVPMYVPSTPQPSGGVPGRPPAVPMMSPMMQPPTLYSGSPVMMHSPHVQPPQAYVNNSGNRSQPSVNFEHAPGRSQPGQPSQQPYAANAFVARPAW